MTTELTTTTLTREQLYERIWSAPMTQLIEELGINRAALIKLCVAHQIPRPGMKYWADIHMGLSPARLPLPEAPPNAPSAISITRPSTPPRVLVRQAIATLGNAMPKVAVEAPVETPEIINQHKQIRPEGGVLPYGSAKMAARADAIENALRATMVERGHKLEFDSDSYSRWPLVFIGGEKIRYYIYEPDRSYRHQFTKAELKKNPYVISGRDWEQRKDPSGILKLGIMADYGVAKLTWGDERGRPLETQLGEIIIAMEVIATIAAKETAMRNEKAQKDYMRRKEKEKREYMERLQDERWKRVCKVVDGWHQSQRVRAFFSAFKEAVADDKRLTRRVAKWEAWAGEYLWYLDPLPSDPEAVFRRLARPKRRRYSYEEEDELD